VLAGVLAVTTIAVVGLGIGPVLADQRDADAPPSATDGAHEPASCTPAAPASPIPTPAADDTVDTVDTATGRGMTLQVTVPATVRVESGEDAVLRIATNAGRAPAPGDHVYVRGADGTYTAAAPSLVTRVLSARWTDGSWCDTTQVHTATE
jgi:hypothetical protein